jgi:undecaprenyl-diphosphatase
MLLLTAVLLSLSEYLSNRQQGEGRPVGFKDAIIIGIAQAFAVLPGLSRSGTTISTGLMLGVRKSDVAQFSFLMVLVPILGEAFLELVGGEFAGEASGIPALSLVLGFASAFLSGLFACTLMVNIVKRAKLWLFAVYCVIVGIACIVSSII